ncbi:S-adenosyl-L-methionine-dependent methyltransferase [Aspergillus steynii IBT 23096]|uniref:S-adenosyl-L-methionine-dependent methyltransferase n=1 Tax=Aspergillus steynii IBT 23096 TaxID=1392250 RepID=A0A2I2GS36_9EURO|nr:S-adenosyl-L-methionine-dependent methyltransferase [Aspergillus steynii IBT 23096]PLB55673.1 S-adenosyl-L-methionine-dependent methyltransferase [Aspergillus steynii IBT 23096]
MPFDLKDRLAQYIGACEPLLYAFSFRWKAFRSSSDGASSAQDRGFAEWFQEVAPLFKEREESSKLPYLASTAHGTVLELGPGTGSQIPRYNLSQITKIYGVEPNVVFAKALESQIAQFNASDVYVPVYGRVEEESVLEKYGITDESLDCVTSFQVLCSVDRPEETVERLWRLLRPGGEFVFWEHEASRDLVTWVVQKFWSILWPLAHSGCRLDRPVGDIVLKSAKWEVVEFEREGEKWAVMPRVYGRLRKPKTAE